MQGDLTVGAAWRWQVFNAWDRHIIKCIFNGVRVNVIGFGFWLLINRKLINPIWFCTQWEGFLMNFE